MKTLILEWIFWIGIVLILIGIGVFIGMEIDYTSKKISPIDNIVMVKRCGKKIISIH